WCRPGAPPTWPSSIRPPSATRPPSRIRTSIRSAFPTWSSTGRWGWQARAITRCRPAACSPPPEDLRGPGDRAELLLRDLGRGQRIVGEGRETAVRGEQHALGAEERDGAPPARHDLLRALHAVVFLVHHAHPDADALRQRLENVDLAGPLGA